VDPIDFDANSSNNKDEINVDENYSKAKTNNQFDTAVAEEQDEYV
jgi:hypothetical protein